MVSQGRAILGIGTGWFELERDQLGYEFGPSPTASADSTRPCRSSADAQRRAAHLLRHLVPHTEAVANPRFREHIPLMIGGSGEKKTIPPAARHFDHLNVIVAFDELDR